MSKVMPYMSNAVVLWTRLYVNWIVSEMKRQLSASACDAICDADYDISSDPTAPQTKRQKLLESDGKLYNN